MRANQLVSFVIPDITLLIVGLMCACFAWLVLFVPTGQLKACRARRVTSADLVLLCQLLALQAATASHYPFLRSLVHKIHIAHPKSCLQNRSAMLAPLANNPAPALSSVLPRAFHHPSTSTPSSATPPKAKSQSF